MKEITNLFGIVLIIIGIATLVWQGFTYTKKEQVAQIGSLQVTADTQKTVYFPPMLGGLSLVAGVVLVYLSRKNMK